jgi:hypothetical protein
MGEEFYAVLYAALLANCPVDTRNMVTHITLEDYGDHYKITISGPTADYDYAKAVNYNRQRGPKEIRNYHWVERVLRQVSEVFGGNVEYELS